MECPKCHRIVDDSVSVCPNCSEPLGEENDSEFEEPPKTQKIKKKHINLRKNLFRKSKARQDENSKEVRSFKEVFRRRLKLFISIAGVVLIAVVVTAVIISSINSKGLKAARTLSEYIGKPISETQKEKSIDLLDMSRFDGFNNSLDFNFITESEKSLIIDGVKYPKWATCVTLDKNDRIYTVSYTDFSVCKSNYKGQKCGSEINLDSVEMGASFSSVNKLINLEPFRITYTDIYQIYVYRYFYINSSGDEQQMILNVTFDKKDKFCYYSSEKVPTIFKTSK